MGSPGRLRVLVVPALAAAALALIAAGCGGSSTSGGGGGKTASGLQEVKVIASGADTYPYSALLTVAEQKGWFKQQGLKLTIISSESGGGGVAQVLATGGANIGIGSGASAVPLAQNSSSNVQLLANWYPVNDFVWLTPKSGAKVNGATLGYTSPGSSTDLMLKAIAAARPSWHFKPVAVGSPGANWAAAKSGKITAAWQLPPFTEQVTATQGAHLLFAARDVVGDVPADLVYANKGYIGQHPEVISGFLKAMDKAFTYARTQPKAAAADLGKIISISPKYIQQAIKEYPGGYTLKTSPKALTNLSKMLVETHTISSPVQWSKLMTEKYLPADARAPLPAASG